MTSILRATQILFWLVTASTHAAPQLVFDPPPCIFTIQDRIYDLSAFRNVVVSGFEDNGAYVQTSLCGPRPKKVSLSAELVASPHGLALILFLSPLTWATKKNHAIISRAF